MARLWKRYTSDVYKGLRYLATWPPSGGVEVGEIAVFQDRALERQTTLEQFGICIETVAGSAVDTVGWTSTNAVTLKPSAAAAAVPIDPSLTIEAQLEVEFSAKHATFLRGEGSQQYTLDGLHKLKREMLRLYEEGKWELDWVLVTQVVKVQRLITLISDTKGASARLALSGGAAQDAGGLATVRGQLQVIDTSGMAYTEEGIENATPLYQAIRVQRRLIKEDRVKRVNKRGRARPEEGEIQVVDVTF